MDLTGIIQHFATTGGIGKITPHGGGHINDNFLIRNNSPAHPDYLLQRVNHHVFRDVELLMNNMTLVTGHIAGQLGHLPPEERSRRSLEIIPTKGGKPFFKDGVGDYWRVLNFIPDHVVFDSTDDQEVAREGARMFGEFIRMLSSLPPAEIGDSIPRFHDIRWRLSGLAKSVVENTADRARLVKEELRYIESRTALVTTIQRLGEKGAIPLRVTHNDTKINNVLFDREKKGLCVVDLDTVMPGYVHYDFGDGIRTFTNTGREDDTDLGNVQMDLGLYEAFAEGFLEATREILTPAEIGSLVYAGVLFPFIMGVRFLTDFLSGDVYFKTTFGDHNLVRARAQFKLAMDAESKMEPAGAIIRKLASTEDG